MHIAVQGREGSLGRKEAGQPQLLSISGLPPLNDAQTSVSDLPVSSIMIILILYIYIFINLLEP
jgi:hypothetical protein